MRYETFRANWEHAQTAARLHLQAAAADETLDLASLARTYSALVAAKPHSIHGPYYVTATVYWRWSSLLTARAATSEDDVHAELFGRSGGRRRAVMAPWVRVDLKFNATLSHGKAVALPSPAALQRWSVETGDGVEEVWAPSLRKKRRKEVRGLPVVEQWCGEPAARVEFNTDGEPRLTRVEMHAWRGVEFAPAWSGSDVEWSPTLQRDLDALALRVRDGLDVWTKKLGLS